jgi:hypothetical protein
LGSDLDSATEELVSQASRTSMLVALLITLRLDLERRRSEKLSLIRITNLVHSAPTSIILLDSELVSATEELVSATEELVSATEELVSQANRTSMPEVLQITLLQDSARRSENGLKKPHFTKIYL